MGYTNRAYGDNDGSGWISVGSDLQNFTWNVQYSNPGAIRWDEGTNLPIINTWINENNIEHSGHYGLGGKWGAIHGLDWLRERAWMAINCRNNPNNFDYCNIRRNNERFNEILEEVVDTVNAYSERPDANPTYFEYRSVIENNIKDSDNDGVDDQSMYDILLKKNELLRAENSNRSSTTAFGFNYDPFNVNDPIQSFFELPEDTSNLQKCTDDRSNSRWWNYGGEQFTCDETWNEIRDYTRRRRQEDPDDPLTRSLPDGLLIPGIVKKKPCIFEGDVENCISQDSNSSNPRDNPRDNYLLEFPESLQYINSLAEIPTLHGGMDGRGIMHACCINMNNEQPQENVLESNFIPTNVLGLGPTLPDNNKRFTCYDPSDYLETGKTINDNVLENLWGCPGPVESINDHRTPLPECIPLSADSDTTRNVNGVDLPLDIYGNIIYPGTETETTVYRGNLCNRDILRTCSDINKVGLGSNPVEFNCSESENLLSSQPGMIDCDEDGCTEEICCTRTPRTCGNVNATSIDSGEEQQSYDCRHHSLDLDLDPSSILCDLNNCSADRCCTEPVRSCGDVNKVGLDNNPTEHTCMNDMLLDTNPQNIICPEEGCADDICCTIYKKTCADINRVGLDNSPEPHTCTRNLLDPDPQDIICPDEGCDDDICCTTFDYPRTCGDINKDGVDNDPVSYTCIDNLLDPNPEGINCPESGCDEEICCTVPKPSVVCLEQDHCKSHNMENMCITKVDPTDILNTIHYYFCNESDGSVLENIDGIDIWNHYIVNENGEVEKCEDGNMYVNNICNRCNYQTGCNVDNFDLPCVFNNDTFYLQCISPEYHSSN